MWKVSAVVASIMVVDMLTHCVLFNCVCNLKITQRDVQYILICKLMLYEFKLGHNTRETTKNICFTKGEKAVDHCTVTRWLK